MLMRRKGWEGFLEEVGFWLEQRVNSIQKDQEGWAGCAEATRRVTLEGFFFFFNFIYLFIFGCVGSSLLHAGFL